MYSGQHLVCNTAVSRPLPADMTIVTFLSDVLCVYCVFTQKNTYNIFEYAVYYAIIRIIIDILRVICYNIRRYRKRGERMETTTIYRINETDRTINIAQSVIDTDEYNVPLVKTQMKKIIVTAKTLYSHPKNVSKIYAALHTDLAW